MEGRKRVSKVDSTTAMLGLVPQRSVYEFDLFLWSRLRRLARERAQQATYQFQLSWDTLKVIARFDDRRLSLLASDVALSFQLMTPDTSILEALQRASSITAWPRNFDTQKTFEQTYWLMLSRLVAQAALSAPLCLGLSQTLAQAIAPATSCQLFLLAERLTLQWAWQGDECHLRETLVQLSLTPSSCPAWVKKKGIPPLCPITPDSLSRANWLRWAMRPS
jgi:hypothetical protein